MARACARSRPTCAMSRQRFSLACRASGKRCRLVSWCNWRRRDARSAGSPGKPWHRQNGARNDRALPRPPSLPHPPPPAPPHPPPSQRRNARARRGPAHLRERGGEGGRVPAVARAVWRVGATRPARAEQNLRAFTVKSKKGSECVHPQRSLRTRGGAGGEPGAVWVWGRRSNDTQGQNAICVLIGVNPGHFSRDFVWRVKRHATRVGKAARQNGLRGGARALRRRLGLGWGRLGCG